MKFFEKNGIFWQFLRKNGNFLVIFEKKWQFSGNFWTFKLQFSGGSVVETQVRVQQDTTNTNMTSINKKNKNVQQKLLLNILY